MTSTLQLSIRWTDDFLKWNKSIYDKAIAFKSNEIWVPDLIASNNVNNFKFESKESYLIGYANNIFDFTEKINILYLLPRMENVDGCFQ